MSGVESVETHKALIALAEREALIDRALDLLLRARRDHATWSDLIVWRNDVDEFVAEVRP